MSQKTFTLVDAKLRALIDSKPSGDFRTQIYDRWELWKSILEVDIAEQRELFSKMLHPNAEGDTISGELRVGPRTVTLIAEALFLLLIVSICLSDENTKETWKSVKDKLTMTAIGLVYWSGPAEGDKEVIEIDADIGVGKLLEKENSKIIVMAQSTLTDDEIFNDDIAGEINRVGLLTHPKYPRLLITKDRRFERMLKNSDISELKLYLQGKIDTYNNWIKKAVNEFVL